MTMALSCGSPWLSISTSPRSTGRLLFGRRTRPTETEPHLISVFRNRMMLPQEQRNEQAATEALESLKAPLTVLDGHLKGRPHLLGTDYTVADLNVASVLLLAPMIGVDMSGAPAARAWLDKCLARPAAQKMRSYK